MPTRGPQAGPIQFYYSGLQPMIAEVMKIQNGLENIDMSGAVRGAGRVWQENFKQQGWLASQGWKPLSEFTQNIRAWRGYNESSPILEQSGGLRKAAADYPAGMAKGQKTMSRTTSATPMSDGTPTTISVRTGNNRATLKISGSKVENNRGGKDEGRTWTGGGVYRLPRRRFWFVSPEVRSEIEVELAASIRELSKLL